MRWFTIIHLVPCLLLGCPDTDIEVGPDDDTVADDDDDDTTEDPGDDDSSLPLDGDGDGWTVEDGDCDDADPAVHPGATDSPCNAVDSDCDGVGGDAAAAVVDGVEYGSFTEAMDIIADGQTLEICPGTHTESIEVGEDRELTITSYSGDRDDTILDGEGVRQIASIGLRSDVTLRALTFRGGYGAWFWDGNSCGGALYTQAATTSIEDCVFRDNLAGAEEHKLGGALCHWLDEDSGSSRLQVTNSVFEDNGSQEIESLGGGIYAYTRDTLTLDIVDCTFAGNTSSGSGGAARIRGEPLHLTVSESRFEGNWIGDGWYGGADGGALQVLE